MSRTATPPDAMWVNRVMNGSRVASNGRVLTKEKSLKSQRMDDDLTHERTRYRRTQGGCCALHPGVMFFYQL